MPDQFAAVDEKTMPANDLKGLIAWLKASPGKSSTGIYAVGLRIWFAFFQKATGTRFALVPYRGEAPAIQDLMAGQIDMLIDGHPASECPVVGD